MSDVELVEVCNSESEVKQTVPEPPEGLFEKLEDFPEALEYIKILQKQIKKHLRRLRRFKSKFKQQRKKIDVGTQTGDLPNGTANTAKSIAEEIKEAAEEATQNTGFVYDESSGLYYDSTTGFYYNAEYGLYYDSSSGTYMTYKQETNTYEFHSQVVPTQDTHPQTKEHYKKRKAKQDKDEAKAAKSARLVATEDTEYETEEGECSRSESEQSESEINSDTSDVSKQWPPCMRIIVEQSKSPKIKIGSLHILTFEGGTLGREGDHAILLPDINISKCHLRFSFDKEANQFSVVDLGSRNGTVLNGKRMAASKQESEAFEVAHGSRIQIGSIVLLCHVHEGSKTCGLCEPGLVQACEVQAVDKVTKVSKSAKHKAELKNLRKKFGVSAYEDDNTKLASGYTDRAQHRRETVGSQNPHEKTEVASVNESIPSQNKGFKMLAKMGWKEGQSLGKEGQGIVEPVRLVSNPGTSGVGNSEAPIPDVDSDKSKHMIWKKTQERYKKLPNSTVFEDSD